MNWTIFIIFVIALFLTIMWVCDFLIALCKALSKIPNVDHGTFRAIWAFVIAILWAFVYCL